MADPIEIKYEVYKVADVTAHASQGLAALVLDTDKGRIALHMRRVLFEYLEHDIRQALDREGPPAQSR